jgi:WD40 repeat protein
VSYESDQVHTFPVFTDASSAAGPTLEEIEASCEASANDPDFCLPELAAYGGHLNRFTFLKNPKYAGPNDEYICTGSDSGNAWIYEKKTGTVVSLHGADSNTCNGVIPHPYLPFFITYGIDSTAKLWRAAHPVDPKVDNSSSGQVKASAKVQHELSPVARTYALIMNQQSCQTLLRQVKKYPVVAILLRVHIVV